MFDTGLFILQSARGQKVSSKVYSIRQTWLKDSRVTSQRKKLFSKILNFRELKLKPTKM